MEKGTWRCRKKTAPRGERRGRVSPQRKKESREGKAKTIKKRIEDIAAEGRGNFGGEEQRLVQRVEKTLRRNRSRISSP